MTGNQLQITGGVTQALLAALDQVHTAITAQLQGPDGKPIGTAVYMHMPVGHPIDPTMHSFAWTPAGGSTTAAVAADGQFVPAPAAAPAATGATPAAALANVPPGPDPKLQHSMASAYNTSRLVDNMLMVTDQGIARAWPERTVSIEYETALAGMQAEPVPPPAPDVQARIDAAKKTLYLMDADGNMTGYTPKFAAYRHNFKAWEDAVSAYAAAYASAMADPVQGQAWPVTSAKYQTDIDQSYNDLTAMGSKEIEDAIATMQSIGGSAAAALIGEARKLFAAYSIGLAGGIGVRVPWSYIDPESWWDHKNNDFGIHQVHAESSQFAAGGSGGSSSFGHSFYQNSSSSTSGSAGFDLGFVSLGANASHDETNSDWGAHQDTSSWERHSDSSSSATIDFEWFIASIERPWLLGDLFHMDGWYIVGKPKGCISDGTVAGQMGDAGQDKLLPMLPKAFVIMRNITITADAWGEAGSAFDRAMADGANHTGSSSNSYGGSVGYFGLGGSVQHSDSESGGVFDSGQTDSHGWSFTRHGQGGSLNLLGGQIVGWIGEIQPLAPREDAPKDAAKDAQPNAPAPAGAH